MKMLSVFVIGCFLNLVLAVPLQAESLYQDTRLLSEEAIFQKSASEGSFEARLKEIRGRQDSGRAIFFAGCGLGLAYLAGLYFSEKVSFEYYFGMPLLTTAIVWYGFAEAVAANNEEAIFMQQNQIRGTREAE